MHTKTGYHHGDLRSALVAAGLELTRTGGPEALSVRAATRLAGVTPNAAYRHFADRVALMHAVAESIQRTMAGQMRTSGPATDAAGAWARLHAIGMGYIRFALAEPGWFAVAFPRVATDTDGRASPLTALPYLALREALDALVHLGALTPAQRAGAEWPCWSAVHGFAVLALDGPLRGRPAAEIHRAGRRTVDLVLAGLAGGTGQAG